MDLDALAAFAQVVESGGFSSAARALGQSRQRVHRRIVALEKQIGVRLLDRTTRSVRATATGHQLLAHALRVRDHGRAAHAALRTATERPSGTLRVTATPMIGELVLDPVIAQFLERWPLTRVEVILSMGLEPLLERDLDLALRFGTLADSSLFARRLGSAQGVTCASPEYLARAGRPDRPEELASHSLLTFSARPGQTFRWPIGDGQPPLTVRPRLCSTGERHVVNACLAGVGVARLPYVLAYRHLETGKLIELLPGWRMPPTPMHAVYASRIEGNATLEAFLTSISRRIGALRWCPPPT